MTALGSVTGAAPGGAAAGEPLSFAQRRLWFLDRLAGDHLEYLDPIALRLRGRLDVVALRAALDAIIERHAVLRTRYVVVRAEPHQIVDAPRRSAVQLRALRALADDERERAARQLAERAAGEPIDLTAAPVRIVLVSLSAADHLLIIVIHHIATDAWSRSLLARELHELYGAFERGEPASPAIPAMSYVEFARWQRDLLTDATVERMTDFWRGHLAGLQPLDLPTDRPRPPVRDAKGAAVPFAVSRKLRRRVAELGRRYRATPFMTFLAAYAVLLHRYSGQADIAVGTPTAGRNRVEVEDVVGCFVNMLVTRTDVSGDPTVGQVLTRVRDGMLRVYAHQDMPFELLVERLGQWRDLSINPVFQVVFAWQSTPSTGYTLPGIDVTSIQVARRTAKFDLTVRLAPAADGGLDGEVEYAAALFEPTTVERFAARYVRLLEQIAADPDRPLSRLDLLLPDDRTVLREAARAGDRPATPTDTLHQLFERQAARAPDAVAIHDERGELTYGHLNRRANGLAHLLRALGVGADRVVAVIAEPRAESIVALLAVLKAGGAYLPLDPNTPAGRITSILADARPAVLVTRVPVTGVDHPTTVVLDRDRERIDRHPPGDPEPTAAPHNIAYVIYTSGSTGAPKGVMVTHANVVALLRAVRPEFRLRPDDVWTLFHSAAFDFAVWEMFGALLHGGRLVIVPAETARSPEKLLELVTARRVTILSQTPSAFRGLVQVATACQAPLDHLRVVVFGGEAVDLAALRPWLDRYGDRTPELVNMYGITETTVHVTARRLTRTDLVRRYAPIGRPLPHLRVHLLDHAMNPAPVGIPAEIYVGGTGLARGYLNRPGLTAERFVPDPFGVEPGARLYRTGDLARLLADGDVECLGRTDDQVKIRGFRIELGEVEAALNSHPAVAAGAVGTYRVAGADPQLVAYVVAKNGGITPAELRAGLAERLPGYMVPAWYVTLPALPRTIGGKVDRRALPVPDVSRGQVGGARGYVAPRSPAETSMTWVWTAELGLDRVGVEDDFFDLGGDSIRAVRLVGALRAQGWPVTVELIFQHRTVAGLLRALEGTAETVADERVQPFDLVAPATRERLPAGVTDAYPLSMTQLGMLFEMDAARDTLPYHNVVSYPVRDPGGFRAAAFHRACAGLVAAHDILRTSFDLVSYDDPVQLVHRHAVPEVTIRDLRHVTDADRLVDSARRQEAAVVVDVARAPLMRVRVDVVEDDRWILTVTENHAILDGWSHHLVVNELLRRYRDAVDRRAASAPEPGQRSAGVRYADFIALEQAALRDAGSAAFWSGRIEAYEPLVLPEPGSDPGAPGGVRRERIELRPVERRLRAIGHTHRLPVKTLLLTAHVAALAWYTGERRFLTGLVCNGRPEVRGADRLTGMFLNTVPFGVPVSGGWIELTRAVHAEELAIWPHRRYPMPAMQQRWGGGRRLLCTLFSYQDFEVLHPGMVDVDGIVDVLPLEFPIKVSTEPGALVVTGRTDRLVPEVIGRLAELHRRALHRLAADGDGPVHEGGGR